MNLAFGYFPYSQDCYQSISFIESSMNTSENPAGLLISTSGPLIYYSSELKQYSSDVMFALLLIYLSILCLRENPRIVNFIMLGIAGVLSIGISHPSIFVLAGIGSILTVEKILKKHIHSLPGFLEWGWCGDLHSGSPIWFPCVTW
jgi:hypothetical protein